MTKKTGLTLNEVMAESLSNPDVSEAYLAELAKEKFPLPPSIARDELMVNELREDPDYALLYLQTLFDGCYELVGNEAFLIGLNRVLEAGITPVITILGQRAEISLEDDGHTLRGKFLNVNGYCDFVADNARALAVEAAISLEEWAEDCEVSGVEPFKPEVESDE